MQRQESRQRREKHASKRYRIKKLRRSVRKSVPRLQLRRKLPGEQMTKILLAKVKKISRMFRHNLVGPYYQVRHVLSLMFDSPLSRDLHSNVLSPK